MGGATAVLAAAQDQRIETVILDSTHAHIFDVLGQSLESDRGIPWFPGAPASLAAIWLRLGLDLQEADAAVAIPALGHRPLLLLHGTADEKDVPERSVAVIDRAAQAAGVPVELHMRPGGTHGRVIDTCPVDWGRWSVEFLDRAFSLPATRCGEFARARQCLALEVCGCGPPIGPVAEAGSRPFPSRWPSREWPGPSSMAKQGVAPTAVPSKRSRRAGVASSPEAIQTPKAPGEGLDRAHPPKHSVRGASRSLL